MDFGSLPELANHFVNATQAIIPLATEAVKNIYDSGMNIWTGVTDPAAMPSAERNIQLMKLGSVGFGLYMAAVGRNIHGCIGCSIGVSETLLKLHKAGAKIRHPSP